MREVFADTFYWLALLLARDEHHAIVTRTAPPERMVTSWAVQIEVMDALSQRDLRPLATQFWRATSSNLRLTVVPLDEALLNRGADLYEQRLDKDWSLTDCVSFVIMQDRGIWEALTGDHHFVQAGFSILFD